MSAVIVLLTSPSKPLANFPQPPKTNGIHIFKIRFICTQRRIIPISH
uniref:Uncharacterized protein n=1 Tax=Rhizophora mucronata TaxID=61149 RepID=A0A2P2LUL5_RHIMU